MQLNARHVLMVAGGLLVLFVILAWFRPMTEGFHADLSDLVYPAYVHTHPHVHTAADALYDEDRWPRHRHHHHRHLWDANELEDFAYPRVPLSQSVAETLLHRVYSDSLEINRATDTLLSASRPCHSLFDHVRHLRRLERFPENVVTITNALSRTVTALRITASSYRQTVIDALAKCGYPPHLTPSTVLM